MKLQKMTVQHKKVGRKVGHRKLHSGAHLSVLLAGLALSALAVPLQAQEIKGDAEAGAQKITMCIGCHAIQGYRTSYPTIYMVPKIHGQTGKYIENALIAYRGGDRTNTTMAAVAGSLTDQDIADLAAYYGKPVENK